MGEVQITWAKFKDLFSIGEAEIKLAGRGLVLVNGFSHDENDPNGSGKSSLAHKSLSWCLWGQTAIGAKADKVKRKGSKSAEAWVQFIGVDGQKYQVVRMRGPNSLHFMRENGEQWEDLSQKLEKETQPLIDQALGRNFQSWVQSDFFGQGRKLSYAELTPAAQKLVLDEILPLEQLATWEENAVRLAKQLDEEETVHAQALTKLSGSLNSLHNILATLQRQHESAASINQMRLVELRNSIENAEAGQHNLINEIAELDKQLALISPNIDAQKMAAIINVQMHNDGWVEIDIKKKDSLQKVLEWSNYIAATKATLIPETAACHVCQRDFEPAKLEAVKIKNVETLMNLEASNRRLADAQEFAKYADDKSGEYAKVIHDAKHAVVELDTIIANRSMIQKQRAVLVHMYSSNSLDVLKQELASIESAPNPFAESLNQTNANIAKQLNEQLEITAARDKVRTRKDKISFWRSAFKKDIKNLLYREITEFLNTRANYYLAEMGNPQLQVEFTTVKELASGEAKEDFNVNVHSATGGESYDMLSGGEQQLSSFAIGLALADLAASQAAGECRFMVLDEPFTNLGPTNCERLIDFIQRILVPRKDTILLISNEQGLQELIGNQIYVEKRDGITSLGGAQ